MFNVLCAWSATIDSIVMIDTILMCSHNNLGATLPGNGDHDTILAPGMDEWLGFDAIIVCSSWWYSSHDRAKKPVVRCFPISRVVVAIVESREVFQMRLDIGLVQVLNEWIDFAFQEDILRVCRSSSSLTPIIPQVAIIRDIHKEYAILGPVKDGE